MLLVNIIVELSKYVNIVLVAIYTYYTFRVFGYSDKKKQNKIYRKMSYIIFYYHFICYLILFINTQNIKIIFLYIMEVVAMILVLSLYQWIYVNLSKQILHNMLFLLTTGFIMLTRLSYDKAVKQFIIASAALALCLIIPLLIDKLKYLSL